MEYSSSGDMKRVVAVNDMSCFGKCSLTVAVPVISAFGVEAVPLPTAILSTHTGGFSGFTCLDMTDEMKKIIAHWKTIGFRVDGIYTGYFMNGGQIDIVLDFIKEFSNPDTAVIVDPVMADNGRLYTGFDMSFKEDMKKLCAVSDVITPNITEAMLLTDMEYSDIITRESLNRCLDKMENMKLKRAVITGVRLNDTDIGYVWRDFTSGEAGEVFFPYEQMRLHGCGDVFASVLCGGIVKKDSFAGAVRRAADFTERCIRTTEADIENHWYGMKFEKNLREGI
jgi:pyridoxine kinase